MKEQLKKLFKEHLKAWNDIPEFYITKCGETVEEMREYEGFVPQLMFLLLFPVLIFIGFIIIASVYFYCIAILFYDFIRSLTGRYG